MKNEAIIECVPNFSEGQDVARVKQIVAAMRVDDVHLLDWSLDAAHNRSVVTIAGPPAAVIESAVRGAGKAAELKLSDPDYKNFRQYVTDFRALLLPAFQQDQKDAANAKTAAANAPKVAPAAPVAPIANRQS